MDDKSISAMFDHLNVAILASDENYTIIYQNEKCRSLFKKVFNKSDYIGSNLNDCHSAETVDKVKGYYSDYKNKTRQLDYYTIEEPDGKVTIVNVPFYEGDKFKGVVEFIYECALD